MTFQKDFDQTLLSDVHIPEEPYAQLEIPTFHLGCITAAFGCS